MYSLPITRQTNKRANGLSRDMAGDFECASRTLPLDGGQARVSPTENGLSGHGWCGNLEMGIIVGPQHDTVEYRRIERREGEGEVLVVRVGPRVCVRKRSVD